MLGLAAFAALAGMIVWAGKKVRQQDRENEELFRKEVARLNQEDEEREGSMNTRFLAPFGADDSELYFGNRLFPGLTPPSAESVLARAEPQLGYDLLMNMTKARVAMNAMDNLSSAVPVLASRPEFSGVEFYHGKRRVGLFGSEEVFGVRGVR